MEKRALKRLAVGAAVVAVVALGLAAAIGVVWGPLGWGGKWGDARWGSGAARQSIDQRESVEIGNLERLVIETSSEEIRVRRGEAREVALHFHGTFSAANPEAAPRLTVSRDGSRALGRVERANLVGAGWQLGDLVLEVEVPRAYGGELSLRSVSGGIIVGELSLPRLELASTSGDIRADRLGGRSLLLSTVSGEIAVQAAGAASTEFSSTSGSVRLAELGGSLRGETVSGDQELDFAAPPGAVQLRSTSGEVSLRLPTGSAFRLEARSTSGDVTCTLPIQLDEYSSGAGRNVLLGTVGGGGELISLRTVSGDIRIRD